MAFGAAMNTGAIELHLGRVVWHGAGAPEAQVFAAAVQDAMSRALQLQPSRTAARPTPLQRAAEAVAQQVLQRGSGGTG